MSFNNDGWIPICYPLTAWVSTPGSFRNFGNDVHVACWDLSGANLGAKTRYKWGYIKTPVSRVKEPQEIPPIFDHLLGFEHYSIYNDRLGAVGRVFCIFTCYCP